MRRHRRAIIYRAKQFVMRECGVRTQQVRNVSSVQALVTLSVNGQEGKMKRSLLCAAAAAAMIALTAPAQAGIADPGLNNAAPATLQHVRYYRHHRSYHHSRHHWRSGWSAFAYSPRHRHHSCWTERVRVWHHWTWVRHCGWRSW